MKPIQSFTAFILALTLLTPTAALFSCAPTDAAATPPALETENSSETEPPTEEQPSSAAPSPAPEPEPEPEPEPVVQYAQYIRCTGDGVNLRSGAGTSHSVVGKAEKNTTYAVVGKSGNWYKTYYRNEVAYVYATYTAVLQLEKSTDEKIERVIAEGYKLLGVPYVYGAVRYHDGNGKLLSGFNVQKFDCSSLVQYIFHKGAKKLLQVNTRTQVKQGKRVARSALQRGDCIFFTNESRKHLTGVERVGHVALYLGNDYILHTSSDYARIEKISSTRWSYYIEARRFV